MPAIARRLWLYERISDRPDVRRFTHPEDLRRDERDHENDYCEVAVDGVCSVGTPSPQPAHFSLAPPASFHAPMPPSIWHAAARPASRAACPATAPRPPT